MTITLSTISILSLAGLVWLISKHWHLTICPICAGVSGTWVWLLAAVWLGFPINPLVPATLLGGTVVGLSYQFEQRLPVSSALLWKTLSIPAGMAAAGSLLSAQWWLFGGASALWFLVAVAFLRPRQHGARGASATNDLREKLKRCC